METGPLGIHALDLNRYGLVVIPIKSGGKSATVKGWNRWKSQRPDAVRKWIARFPTCNVAVNCGASGLTVIDLDDPALFDYAIQRFGETPLQVATPRGGRHLYYRNSGEHCPNVLRTKEGLEIDVRGIGGYVLVPPSVVGGKAYQMMKGGWECIAELPCINNGALNTVKEKPSSSFCEEQKSQTARKDVAQMGEGDGRNNHLFTALLHKSASVDDLEVLREFVNAENSRFGAPLPASEVDKILKSVWRYKQQGRLVLPGCQYVPARPSEIESLSSQALHLLLYLRCKHTKRSERGEPFAIACGAMAKNQVLEDWTDYRYEQARDELVIKGYITCTGFHALNKRLKQYLLVL